MDLIKRLQYSMLAEIGHEQMYRNLARRAPHPALKERYQRSANRAAAAASRYREELAQIRAKKGA